MQIKRVNISVFVGNLTQRGLSVFLYQEIIRPFGQEITFHHPTLAFNCQPFDLIGLSLGVESRVTDELRRQFGNLFFFKAIEELHRKESRDEGEISIGILTHHPLEEDWDTRPSKHGQIKAFTRKDFLTLTPCDVRLIENNSKHIMTKNNIEHAQKFFDVFKPKYDKITSESPSKMRKG